MLMKPVPRQENFNVLNETGKELWQIAETLHMAPASRECV